VNDAFVKNGSDTFTD